MLLVIHYVICSLLCVIVPWSKKKTGGGGKTNQTEKSAGRIQKDAGSLYLLSKLVRTYSHTIFLSFTCIWFCAGVNRAHFIYEMGVCLLPIYDPFPCSPLLLWVVCFLCDL